MSRLTRWILWSGVLVVLMSLDLMITGVFLDWRNVVIPEEAVALRNAFPYVSLHERLEFESQPATDGDEQNAPKIPEATLERLSHVELLFASPDASARALSLQKLHSREVAYFISREGNGRSRWGRRPTPGLLEYSPPAPIPMATAEPESSSGSTVGAPVEPDGERSPDNQLAALPTPTELEQFHLADQVAFTDPWSFGDVRSRDQVAGFVAHGFTYLPAIGDPFNQYPRAVDRGRAREVEFVAAWHVTRLELVSLLKFKEPGVYLSENLPRMEELAHASTRPLYEFERDALAALRAGEDLVTATADDQIVMLGSLRAGRKCLECHSVRRGDLLGAFSYELRRGPPRRVQKTIVQPAA